jgi:DNA-binding transcriptional ArsR family regulator
MGGREDAPDGNPEAEEVRYRTLTQMEKVLRVLVDRHGARATLGEMLAIYAAMARLCKQEQVSIAEISEATGLPKQNLSRWARKRIGDSISLRVNEDDQRVHDVVMMDSLRGQENIERLAELFSIDADPD